MVEYNNYYYDHSIIRMSVLLQCQFHTEIAWCIFQCVLSLRVFSLEADYAKFLSVKLLHGQAEVFGTELIRNKRLTFNAGSKVAVFTWHGCTVEISFGTFVN